MQKTILIVMAIAVTAMIWVGCSTEDQLIGSQSDGFSGLASAIATVWTEMLGDPGIALAVGSGIAVEGTGMVVQPATLDINVPGTSVEQVLLYWSGGSNAGDHAGDDAIIIEGIEVTGDLIGGPAHFFSNVYFSAYRADITDLGLVANGTNSLTLSGMDFPYSQYHENNGAGLVVIYGDGTTSEIMLRDGLDLAFFKFVEPKQTTIPQTFNFVAADADRSAGLSIMAGSVAENRPNEIKVTINGAEQSFLNILGSTDGADFDAITIPVTIPAGATSLTIEAISTNSEDPLGASIAWIVGALDMEIPVFDETGECEGKVSELTLEYLGAEGAEIVVMGKGKGKPGAHGKKGKGKKRGNKDNGGNVIFEGFVAAGEQFTILGNDKKGTLGTEIYFYVNGELNTNMHTSCSQPIGPGLIKGDFEVIEGYSRNGGLLPPL